MEVFPVVIGCVLSPQGPGWVSPGRSQDPIRIAKDVGSPALSEHRRLRGRVRVQPPSNLRADPYRLRRLLS
jgi:hypothetical protein